MARVQCGFIEVCHPIGANTIAVKLDGEGRFGRSTVLMAASRPVQVRALAGTLM